MSVRWSCFLVLASLGCSSASQTIGVHTPDDLAPGTELAVSDLMIDLGRSTTRVVERRSMAGAGCVDGELHVIALGHEHDRNGVRTATTLSEQEYSIDEQRCADGGRLVVLRGGSHLAAQWGIYDFLERLGVRYFHPEQTLYPDGARWPAEPFEIRARPAFQRRSIHAHRTHPIELSPPRDGNPSEAAAYQRRWIDWNVKIRHTELDGWDQELVGTHAYDRGFPRRAGINLLNGQQGGRPVIDPDDPRPEREQIASAIDVQMADVEGLPPVSSFGFQFNPNEFTVVGEQLTVDRLTFITEYITQRWPGVEIRTINHGTGQAPGPVFGVRFFDLSQFAPPQLDVEAHTLMFYDLDRPAPVYGNTSFGFMRDWIVDQQAVRRIHYYPESSWWLTFDLPVPLFLAPVSLEARDRDLQTLRPYIADTAQPDRGVVGHQTFSSGQEWGYWLIDYCTARMTWDLELGWVGCLDHVASAFKDGDALRDVLQEVGTAQVAPLRDPAILAMLVGSDDETEAAHAAGIEFHPLPPRPRDVLSWTDAEVAVFRTASLAPLPAMGGQYRAWADAIAQITSAQSEDHMPWIAELADSLRITGLRFDHAHALYEATLELRSAVAAVDFAAVQAAEAKVAGVEAITEAARAIVTNREDFYRYPPELTIAGDEPGTPGAIPNTTIYPYRYLSRTHRMFYWTRPDEQLAAMFGLDTVTVNDRILLDGRALTIQLIADAVSNLSIAWGDGSTSTVLESHTYVAHGVYDWTLDALHSLGAISHTDRVAVVGRRADFIKGSLSIVTPQGAGVIAGLLPGLAIGFGTDASGDFTAIGELAGGPHITRGTVRRVDRTGTASAPRDLDIALTNVGLVTIFGAVITLEDGGGATDRRLRLTGDLSTEQIIALIVATGGFDEEGARAVVAAQLGHTPETLPQRVTFEIVGIGSDVP